MKPMSGGGLDFAAKKHRKAGRHLGRKISFVGAVAVVVVLRRESYLPV